MAVIRFYRRTALMWLVSPRTCTAASRLPDPWNCIGADLPRKGAACRIPGGLAALHAKRVRRLSITCDEMLQSYYPPVALCNALDCVRLHDCCRAPERLTDALGAVVPRQASRSVAITHLDTVAHILDPFRARAPEWLAASLNRQEVAPCSRVFRHTPSS
jgi:hypothetical protein